jgi:hypothetical protein
LLLEGNRTQLMLALLLMLLLLLLHQRFGSKSRRALEYCSSRDVSVAVTTTATTTSSRITHLSALAFKRKDG